MALLELYYACHAEAMRVKVHVRLVCARAFLKNQSPIAVGLYRHLILRHKWKKKYFLHSQSRPELGRVQKKKKKTDHNLYEPFVRGQEGVFTQSEVHDLHGDCSDWTSKPNPTHITLLFSSECICNALSYYIMTTKP